MSVSISCGACSSPVFLTDEKCSACGRQLDQAERDALVARFEASNADYREAKAIVVRGFIVVLVAGLLQLIRGGIILYVDAMFEPSDMPPAVTHLGLLHLIVGATLVGFFLVRRRSPTTAMVAALAVVIATQVFAFVPSPTRFILGIASVGGVAVTLATLAALLFMLQAVGATRKMKTLVTGGPA